MKRCSQAANSMPRWSMRNMEPGLVHNEHHCRLHTQCSHHDTPQWLLLQAHAHMHNGPIGPLPLASSRSPCSKGFSPTLCDARQAKKPKTQLRPVREGVLSVGFHARARRRAGASALVWSFPLAAALRNRARESVRVGPPGREATAVKTSTLAPLPLTRNGEIGAENDGHSPHNQKNRSTPPVASDVGGTAC